MFVDATTNDVLPRLLLNFNENCLNFVFGLKAQVVPHFCVFINGVVDVETHTSRFRLSFDVNKGVAR
jgi:hypothetical protein